MHPLREELNRFVEGQETAQSILAHIRDCEFCGLYCERYELLLSEIDSAEIVNREDLSEIASSIFTGKSSPNIIHLSPFHRSPLPGQRLLAADGERTNEPVLQNLATWFSQEQDIVVRVMRDTEHAVDFLQVIAPDESLMSHVLIESADAHLTYVTDGQGKVEFKMRQVEDIASIKWQIRLPEAVFRLDALTYDPNRVKSETDTILESPGGDTVSIKLQEKTEGKEIIVRVLALDGNAAYQHARVAITSKSGTEVKPVTPSDTLKFALVDANTEIGIRIFQ